MAMVSIENGNNNVDLLLFETMELLRNNKLKIVNSKVESISLQIQLKTAKSVEFSIDSESFRFNRNIPVDASFEIEQDQSHFIQTVVSDLIKKYRLSSIRKPITVRKTRAGKQKFIPAEEVFKAIERKRG